MQPVPKAFFFPFSFFLYFCHKPLAAPLSVVHFRSVSISVLLPVLGMAFINVKRQCKFSSVSHFTCILTMSSKLKRKMCSLSAEFVAKVMGRL